MEVGGLGILFFFQKADHRVLDLLTLYCWKVLSVKMREYRDRAGVLSSSIKVSMAFAHVVLEHRARSFPREELHENGNHFLNGHIPFGWRFGFEHVQGRPAGRCQTGQRKTIVVQTMLWDVADDVVDQCRVVNNTYAVAAVISWMACCAIR